MKRMACVLALATGTGLALGVNARPVMAEPRMSGPTGFVANDFQISVAAGGVVSDDSSVALEVRYHGGSVNNIELTIDGLQVKKRALNTSKVQGTIRFELDPGTLGEGDHLVAISATDRDGNTATATTQLHVTAGDPSSLASLLFPKKNSMVQGLVPIQVKLDESIRRPFVSFFIDQDFALVNFAPFTYNWDSTRASNGPHTVSIEVMDGDTQAIIKRFSVIVNVNNPGGLTTRQITIPDLNRANQNRNVPVGNNLIESNSKSAKIVSVVRDAGQVAAPSAHFDASGLDTSISRSARPMSELPGSLHASVPHGGLVTPEYKTGIAKPDHTVPPTHYAGTSRPASRQGALGLFANPHELATLDHASLEPALRTSLRPHRVGNIAAMPSSVMSAPAVAAPVIAHSKPVVIAHSKPVVNAHSKPVVIAHTGQTELVGAGAMNARGGAFDVAFDNTRIAFDVPPRVEHGLPLAPFRQIFEHTGGTVKWYGQSQTVHAYNTTREIEFKVGEKSAKVNNVPVKMDAKVYVDRGRAIVPLSFVRDALNVNIQYDAATGHLRIESRH